jgi:glucokinase
VIALGIDIGGTGIKAGCLDADGRRVVELEEPTPAREAPSVLVEAVAGLVRRLQGGVGEAACSLGIGCAGLVEPGPGMVRTSPNLPRVADLPLAEMVLERTGMRPVVLNDANAFTLAEARLGAARGASSVLGLTLGTGVGGGLLLAGRLWEGFHGYAGEIGHTPVSSGGPPCACGLRGCLEAFVGAGAILRRYREGRANAGVAGGPEEALTPKLLAARAREGDAQALEAFRETGDWLGISLGGFVHLFDPEVMVVGGGVSGAADLILPAARESMAARVMLPRAELPAVLPAALGPAAGWIGAALAAAERV